MPDEKGVAGKPDERKVRRPIVQSSDPPRLRGRGRTRRLWDNHSVGPASRPTSLKSDAEQYAGEAAREECTV
jgi:hypothetical protein